MDELSNAFGGTVHRLCEVSIIFLNIEYWEQRGSTRIYSTDSTDYRLYKLY